MSLPSFNHFGARFPFLFPFAQSCYGLRTVPADAWFCEVCTVLVRSAPELRAATFAADGGVVLPAGALAIFFFFFSSRIDQMFVLDVSSFSLAARRFGRGTIAHTRRRTPRRRALRSVSGAVVYA